MADEENDNVKAVEDALGKPVLPELPDSVWKVRTNLIIASVISIAVALADLRIDPGSTFLGLRFTGLTDHLVRTLLFIITVYLLIHFLWAALDAFLEWRLRITGTRLAFVTAGTWANHHADYPNDPRQSTLYSWWVFEAKRIGNLSSNLSTLQDLLQNLNSDLRSEYTSGASDLNIVNNACRPLGEAREAIAKLERSIGEAAKTINAARIPSSLKRFDNWFHLFLRSQNLRWFVIDVLVPVGLAGVALYVLKATT